MHLQFCTVQNKGVKTAQEEKIRSSLSDIQTDIHIDLGAMVARDKALPKRSSTCQSQTFANC